MTPEQRVALSDPVSRKLCLELIDAHARGEAVLWRDVQLVVGPVVKRVRRLARCGVIHAYGQRPARTNQVIARPETAALLEEWAEEMEAEIREIRRVIG